MTLTFKNLIKKYNQKPVLDINNFNIPSGQLLGIVGNNGAGKTTLFKCILDLIQPNEGYILSNNTEVRNSENWKFYTTAYLSPEFLIEFLTPEEYFHFIGKLNHINKKEIETRIVNYLSFMNDEILNQNKLIRNFSSGNKQKIGIMGALIPLPKVLIMDEPFNFLDPSSQIKLKDIIRDYHQNNSATVLISSHNLKFVSEICERIILMEKGKIIKELNGVNTIVLKELEQYFSTN